jgi:hypothetical protein
MPNPSPLRKLIPPLVWPVGILLLVGYCYVGGRVDQGPDRQAIREMARARGAEVRAGDGVDLQGAAGRSVSVSAPLNAVGGVSLVKIPIVILCVLLVVSVVRRTNARDRAERERAARETP